MDLEYVKACIDDLLVTTKGSHMQDLPYFCHPGAQALPWR
jgi:hypothetical protein